MSDVAVSVWVLTTLIVSTALLALVVLFVLWVYVVREVCRRCSARHFDWASLIKDEGGNRCWALVTGATDGIGREFVLQLAAKGFNVAIVGRSAERLRDTASEVASQAEEVDVITIQHDFTAPGWDGFARIRSQMAGKRVTVLVNNVGMTTGQFMYYTDMKEALIEDMLRVNVVSALGMTKAFLPEMLSHQKGLILNVGSFAADLAIPLMQIYAGAKGFLHVWTRSLAKETAPRGVHVELLDTSFVATKMSKITQASLFCPLPRDYVASALATCGVASFSIPYVWHYVMSVTLKALPFYRIAMLKRAVSARHASHSKNEQPEEETVAGVSQ